MKKLLLVLGALTFTGCGTMDTSTCTFIGTCRGSMDAFQCEDELFYAVNNENDIKFIAETSTELSDYCCANDICQAQN